MEADWQNDIKSKGSGANFSGSNPGSLYASMGPWARYYSSWSSVSQSIKGRLATSLRGFSSGLIKWLHVKQLQQHLGHCNSQSVLTFIIFLTSLEPLFFPQIGTWKAGRNTHNIHSKSCHFQSTVTYNIHLFFSMILQSSIFSFRRTEKDSNALASVSTK